MVSPQLAWLFEQNSPAGVLILQTDRTLGICSTSLADCPLSCSSLASLVPGEVGKPP